MSLRFIESNDGVERANVWVKLRLSREGLQTAKERAASNGETWREWVEAQANLGLENALTDGGGEYEQRYGRGGE